MRLFAESRGDKRVNEVTNLRLDFRNRPACRNDLYPLGVLPGDGEVAAPHSLVKVQALRLEPGLL